MMKVFAVVIFLTLFLPLIIQSVDAANVVATVTIKSNTSEDAYILENSDPSDSIDELIQKLNDKPRDLPVFACEANCEFFGVELSKFLEAKIAGPTLAFIGASAAIKLMPATTTGYSFASLKPIGLSFSSLKTVFVSWIYRNSIFKKRLNALASAFLGLTFGNLSDFMFGETNLIGFAIASYLLYGVFFGLVGYHHISWYDYAHFYSFPKTLRTILIALPIIGVLGYFYLLSTGDIFFDILDAISVAGFVIVGPLTVYTAALFLNTTLKIKWILVGVGLISIMTGLVSYSFDVIVGPLRFADFVILFGCGLVILGEYVFSTKFAHTPIFGK